VSAPPPNPAPTRRRWALLGGVATAVLAAAGAGGYYLLRPAPPPVPAVDLSTADPEVAAAVTAAIDAVKADPRNGAAWGKLGMVLRAHDFDTQSVEALRAAERFDPDEPRWPYLQGLTLVLYDPDAGLACLERAAAKARDDRPEPRLRLAEVLLDRGRVAEAEEAARPVADRRAWDPRAGLVLARAAADRGDWAAVLERTEPIRNEPTARKRATLLRADALRRLGRTADADAEAARAAGMPDDEDWDDRYVREVERLQVGRKADLQQGALLLNAGRPAEAAAFLQRAVAKSKNPTPARLLLASALNQANDPAAARALAAEVLRTDPDSVEGWLQLGVAQLLLGDPQAAAESFERVVKLKPDYADGHLKLGHARKGLGDRSGAEKEYEAALRCRPDYEAARKALAELRGGK
jgi:tetratricopeptide (TPR) repeat protein